MKSIPVEQAVGCALCQDMTKIIPGVSKGPRFRRGYVLKAEDVEVLKDMGKEHIYIYEEEDAMIHEEDAARLFAEASRKENLSYGAPSEGKIDLIAEVDGLFTVDVERLFAFNACENVMMATKRTNTLVRKGEKVAGTRIIPLVMEREPVEEAAKHLKGGILSVLPFLGQKVGIVTTGNEVYYGRIKDGFTDVVREKMKAVGMEELGQTYATDSLEDIAGKIRHFLDEGAEVIFCLGGMSVDPDDNTPGAIASVVEELVTYGTPVLPGAMVALGYVEDVPVMGLPGSVMFAKETVFDLLLPRIAAGKRICREEIVALGHGGLL